MGAAFRSVWRDGRVDLPALLEVATAQGLRIEVVPPLGAWVAAGSPLLRGWSTAGREPDPSIRDAITIVSEPTIGGDPTHGIRQLVDIALRALSPAVNDPTTAIQSIGRIHALLRDLLGRGIPGPDVVDASGHVVLHPPDWDAITGRALDEIEQQSHGQPRVRARIATMLDDLLRDAPPDRRPALRRRRALVTGASGAVSGPHPAGSGPGEGDR